MVVSVARLMRLRPARFAVYIAASARSSSASSVSPGLATATPTDSVTCPMDSLPSGRQMRPCSTVPLICSATAADSACTAWPAGPSRPSQPTSRRRAAVAPVAGLRRGAAHPALQARAARSIAWRAGADLKARLGVRIVRGRAKLALIMTRRKGSSMNAPDPRWAAAWSADDGY